MKKIILVNSCESCPYVRQFGTDKKHGYYCQLDYEDDRVLEMDEEGFDEHCSLRDADLFIDSLLYKIFKNPSEETLKVIAK